MLSESVFKALTTYGPPEANGTAVFCRMFDNSFDRLNVKNSAEAVSKAKPFLKPDDLLNNERFVWLIDTFLQYFEDWKHSIAGS